MSKQRRTRLIGSLLVGLMVVAGTGCDTDYFSGGFYDGYEEVSSFFSVDEWWGDSGSSGGYYDPYYADPYYGGGYYDPYGGYGWW